MENLQVHRVQLHLRREDYILKKVFLEDLPRWKNGKNRGNINWEKSIGYEVKFIWGNVNGIIKIINYDSNYRFLNIKLF